MPEEGRPETPAGSTSNNQGEGRAVAERNRRNTTLTTVDTASMIGKLNTLFDDVMSGRDYDERQVKNATNLTGTMIKVLRFEFDIYKHFAASGGKSPEQVIEHDTISSVAAYLRSLGDDVEKANGVGAWTVNRQKATERELLIRANNKRAERGERPFEIGE